MEALPRVAATPLYATAYTCAYWKPGLQVLENHSFFCIYIIFVFKEFHYLGSRVAAKSLLNRYFTETQMEQVLTFAFIP